MTFDAETLLSLLPAIHRIRDIEAAGTLSGLLSTAEAGELAFLQALPAPTVEQQARIKTLGAMAIQGPLAALLSAFAGEIEVLEENLAQLYDDLFIETCADWTIPYIGDLLGIEPLHAVGQSRGLARAEVGHTIALRRRKGTASVLEQLARDVTGWSARAVEYFQHLATTQYMNHLRPGNLVTPSLRNGDALEWVGTAFDPVPHTLDVRHIGKGSGRYNVPNVGIFLWRIDAHRLRLSPAAPHAGDVTGRRFRFSPLGNDTPLYTHPDPEDEVTHIADPINVPVPISRRVLSRETARYYGEGRSLTVHVGEATVATDQIEVCNLSDDGAGWAHDAAPGKVAVDPVLGRLVVAADIELTGPVRVTFHYGAAGDLGGGEYPRPAAPVAPASLARVPDDHPSIQVALDSLAGTGTVEITDNGHYREAVQVLVAAGETIVLRAASGRRPTLELTAPMTLAGGAESGILIDGLVVAGDALRVEAAAGEDGLRRLRLSHTTLVPGISLATDGAPVQPGAASLTVEMADVEVSIERSVVGALRIHPGSHVTVTESVVDAGAPEGIAYSAPDGPDPEPGGALSMEAATVIGLTRCLSLHASNSILLGTVVVTRRQEGCVRFSYVPLGSLVPRRFHSQPTPGDGTGNFPRFTSLRYGAPAYCQLSDRTPPAVHSGAEDESEMGVFHFLFQPQREANLRARLDEYLRVGLQAGILYES